MGKDACFLSCGDGDPEAREGFEKSFLRMTKRAESLNNLASGSHETV